jgi:site-specific recombinase XerD
MEGGPGETAARPRQRAGARMSGSGQGNAAAVDARAPVAPLAGLGDVDGAFRASVLRDRGALAATMRAAELRDDLPAGALAEVWQWLGFLCIVLGRARNTTCARYAEVFVRFLAYVAGATPAWDYRELAAGQFDQWQRWLFLAKHHTASWRAQQLRAIRSFYGWRSRMGLGDDCAAAARGPRIAQRKRRKYTGPQLLALFATVRGAAPEHVRDRAVLLFLLTTGARREECAAITLHQLELQERKGLVRFMGKGSKEREVSIEGPVVEALHAWLREREKLPKVNTDRVWLALAKGRKGHPIGHRTIEAIVARAAKRAHLGEHGVHRFRVTFATALYEEQHDIERIRQILGHESIETTRIYLDVSERHRSVRLSTDRQHAALGTRPAGMPRYINRMMKQRGHGTDGEGI